MVRCVARAAIAGTEKKSPHEAGCKGDPYQKIVAFRRLPIAASFTPSIAGAARPAAHLAAQTVPAGFVMGTPTELPYSVQEPS